MVLISVLSLSAKLVSDINIFCKREIKVWYTSETFHLVVRRASAPKVLSSRKISHTILYVNIKFNTRVDLMFINHGCHYCIYLKLHMVAAIGLIPGCELIINFAGTMLSYPHCSYMVHAFDLCESWRQIVLRTRCITNDISSKNHIKFKLNISWPPLLNVPVYLRFWWSTWMRNQSFQWNQWLFLLHIWLENPPR